MRREEAWRNKYCLDKCNQVSVEETEGKNLTDKTKASEVIEVVFENMTNPRMFFVEKTVEKESSDKIKASNFIGKVFVKCDNCGKNFKTEQDLKDHCDRQT